MLALASVLSCAAAESGGPGDEDPAVSAPARCPVIASRGWAAWVDRMPGLDRRPTLHVTGEIDLPTPGYTETWVVGPADRADPPAQVLELRLAPPDGIVAQVVTPTSVRYAGDAAYPAYRAIHVSCGDRVLAQITNVPDVH